MLVICPCKGCIKRAIKVVEGVERPCHSECKAYADWKRELDKTNAEARRRRLMSRL